MKLFRALVALVFLPVTLAAGATNYTVLAWNNLGMHCMDADFSVFSILPPYNTIAAQAVDGTGHLVTNALTLTYQAVADPTGSINKTSAGKGNFWTDVQPLFGLSLSVDVGLPVPGPNSFSMPGTNNVPQTMMFEPSRSWFVAYGIPITPYDDTLTKNAYPMMRVAAKSGSTTLAKTDIVLPVSDEMDCSACHASGSGPAAMPAAGWVNDPNPQRDYRLNILLKHDELNGTTLMSATPVLCASCHLSEALPGSGQPGTSALTAAVHRRHATVIDPTNGLTLDASANRSACYRCHPGSETKCLRGAMGKAVASDGSMAMQCQSCHGNMSAVGSSSRTGWLDEPSCQSCHTGTAANNNGAIRYTSVFDTPGHRRVAVNQTYATNPNVPASGFSLYRFSRGHGGLYCEACHGSTHAEFPSSHANDNIANTQHQGHEGMMVECNACHGAQPSTVTGGPHGLHPLGATWVSSHANAVETGGAAQCQACHGTDYRGTVLSRSQANRTLSTDYGTKFFWRGFQISCYACHNGPSSETASPNHPAVVANTTGSTTANVSTAIPLTATDADGNTLTLRVVSQPARGTAGLSGTAATYFPDGAFAGVDTFTVAAWDGYTDSNLATVTVTVAASPATGSGLRGDYFDNMDFTGLKISRVDTNVNFDWGTGSPDASIGSDAFSVCWRGWVVPATTQTYAFYTVSDDAARLWINGKLLVNNWTSHSATTNSGAITLLAGQQYDVAMDYFENAGRATAKLLWSTAGQPAGVLPASVLFPQTGLRGEYYGSTNLTGWKLNRVDSQVNFDWGTGSPDALVATNRFSVRWTGSVVARFSETYTFSTVSDDGVRLWINGVQLVNNWTNHGATTNSGTIALTAGKAYDVKMEYYDNTGRAVAKLLWASASQSRQPIPSVWLRPNIGVFALYYPNLNMGGTATTNLASKIDFDWGSGRPTYTVQTNNFSLHAFGQIMPRYSQAYTFYTVSDDAVKLWVNGALIISNWTTHAATTNTGTITLTAGQKYDVRLDYFEGTGNAVMKLLWSSASQSKEIIPPLQWFLATNITTAALGTAPVAGVAAAVPGGIRLILDSPGLATKDTNAGTRRSTLARRSLGEGGSEVHVVAVDCADLTGQWNLTRTGADEGFVVEWELAPVAPYVYEIRCASADSTPVVAGHVVLAPDNALNAYLDEPCAFGPLSATGTFDPDRYELRLSGINEAGEELTLTGTREE